MKTLPVVIARHRWRAMRYPLLVLVMLLLSTPAALGQLGEGDHFGIRIGVWPHKSIDGDLGYVRNVRVVDTLPFIDTLRFDVVAHVDEPASIVPFIEVYGNLHVGGMWWAEAAVGWAQRRKVQVSGVNDSLILVDGIDGDRILLGEGQVVFIPIFIGVRAVKTIGSRQNPHSLYARGGISLIFANESPGQEIHPDVRYSPGSEGAPGFLLGIGGEYFVKRKYALTADVQIRYTQFRYSNQASFNLSSIWVSVGALLSTR